MTLRFFLAVTTVLAAPVAAASPPNGQPGSDVTTTTVTVRTTQTQRKIERTRPGSPLKPRFIEAPGAAVMMIPASFERAQGPFSPL